MNKFKKIKRVLFQLNLIKLFQRVPSYYELTLLIF